VKAQRYDAAVLRAEKREKRIIPQIAQFRSALLAVHGFNTRGTWQKELGPVFQEASIFYESLDYGRVVAGVAFPWTVGKIIPGLLDKYDRLKRFSEKPTVVAHSYGTHVLRRAIEQNPSMVFRRVVLVAGILPQDFPWHYFQDRNQIEQVLNEACPSDLAPRIAKYFVWRDAGSCGAYGFSNGNGNVQNCIHPRTGHSTLLTRLHCREAWVPFLLRGKIPVGCRPPSSQR
jgi:hypothetical protein